MELYGSNITPEYLKKKSSISHEELSAYDICQLLNQYHINCDGYQVEDTFLYKNIIKDPVIAQIQKDDYFHFVLILKSNQNYVYIFDPAIGKYKEPIKDFNNKFQKIVLIPNKTKMYRNIVEDKENKYFRKKVLSSISKKDIIILLLLTIFLSSFEFISSYLLKLIIDTISIIPSFDKQLLLYGILAFITYIFIVNFCNYYRNIRIFNISKELSEKIFDDYIEMTLKQNYLFFKRKNIGDFSSRVTDIIQISNNFLTLLLDLLLNVIFIFIFAIFLSTINFRLFILFCFYIFLYFFIANNFNQILFIKYNKVRDYYSLFESSFIKTYSSIFSIKTLSNTDNSISFLQDKFRENNYRLLDFFKVQNNENFILNICQRLFSVLVITWGIINILNNKLSLGDLVLIITLTQYIGNSFSIITALQPTYQQFKVSLNRLSFIDEENKNSLNNIKNPVELSFKKIILKNVKLTLDQKVILEKNNLEIDFLKNSIIGLTGNSGVGKSSLLRLINRLYSLEEGEILIDDQNINRFSKNYIRKNIILLNQDPEIFPSFLSSLNKENRDKLVSLCYEFKLIESKDLGEKDIEILFLNESKLSNGQRQRLYLCMALSLNPKIIILDETLSGLDYNLVDIFITHVKTHNIKAIVVSHNKNILNKLDKVLFMKNKTLFDTNN